ncbi:MULTISPECIES: class I SAM-dependent methyltransferase [unclassified Cryobacterium]|uniref:class I SAM-dependent methyltransferase n=1 Tax=unclassified Cryobacterium TaxID=2649013 RepID=UPI002AB3B75F|nr:MULTISPECIES: class I SAM-dependent methyltransferase [unclassified Cryobacterium]MDY7529780.1 class I SAM-dependent methyltransferase [Cryobacterium sp. 10C2]MEB0202895.1 class I SAM-dependent methyltransferase [Cryobacterium sp. 5I3]MEB0291163.1 class I SAM-dependent methyltransferase [Cryobacterium sp. 10C2]
MSRTPLKPADLTHPSPPLTGWHSENHWPAPETVVVADDRMTADAAYRLAKSGTGMLWAGDFQNARQLLGALARRIDHIDTARRRTHPPRRGPAALFERTRADAHERARLLGLVLIPLDADYTIALRRAPDARAACLETYGPAGRAATVTSLRELLGVMGAHEWRVRGVVVPALGGSIHAHYGVFSPVRGEYLDLVLAAPLPATASTGSTSAATDASRTAFDIGTGTGVIAAILAGRGFDRVIGTDTSPRALACARENVARLGLTTSVTIEDTDLFPSGLADLIVCNPPWIPGAAVTATDHAVYDPDGQMLQGFLSGLSGHLAPGGEGWLVLSDIAEHLGLRSRDALLDQFDDAGLEVVARLDTKPVHRKAADADDPLHAARAAEVTSLWRLRAASAPERS